MPQWLTPFFFFFFFSFLATPWHIEVPGRGTESQLELQPMPQLWQCWILNPLCRTQDQTHILATTETLPIPLSHSGDASKYISYLNLCERSGYFFTQIDIRESHFFKTRESWKSFERGSGAGVKQVRLACPGSKEKLTLGAVRMNGHCDPESLFFEIWHPAASLASP